MFTFTECAELTLTPSPQPARGGSLRGHLALAGLAIAAVLAVCGAPEEKFTEIDTDSYCCRGADSGPAWTAERVDATAGRSPSCSTPPLIMRPASEAR